ncbi:hypothetical protein [Spirosoma oryzae]|uniref:hypothetical protein n=1 Tax=Spirosoma oryzae TaxID=1469603 RepID=UPI0011B1C6E6|nr:hypothetical protein [Spirosoma oryzae]
MFSHCFASWSIQKWLDAQPLPISKHVLNPYNREFPFYTTELIQQIAVDFTIPIETLDQSVDSLYLIDYFLIANVSIIDERFVKEHILKLIACVGEVYRANREGNWLMILDEDQETWEPKLQGKSGQVHSSFIGYIYSTLMEDDYPSIRSCYLFSDNNSTI